ncbi:MAG: ferredoxin family protein [Candidatus Bathyarchaeota archaeon]|nr:ferredoxin family protein [Candidatus Bathyarchaeota archaeon]
MERKQMLEKTYRGIPREEIPWYPIIDYGKCVACGKCVEFCHNHAFDFEEREGKKRTVVKNPYHCVVLCRGCEGICPVGAISHPSAEKTRRIIRKLKRAKK